MARLNVSIPDTLYERLDRQRDRVNASKVCAAALQKELDMIEGRAARPAASSVERLVQRLQGRRDVWHRRGRQDGEAWAADVASVEELREIGEEWEDDGEYDVDDGDLPRSFQWRGHVLRWVLDEAWDAGAWERLRDHLADELGQPPGAVRLGVRERHYLLKQLGYEVSESQNPDTDGASTHAAAAFRRDKGLPHAEYLGPLGWAAAISEYAPRLGLPAVNAAAMDQVYTEFTRQGLKAAYLRGWHHAVRDLWEEAKERLEEDWDE